MGINDKDFYASHGISYDIEEMQIEYTKRVIKQAKIEVLTEIQLKIENHTMTSGVTNQGTWNECIACCSRIIQQKINALKGESEEVEDVDQT